MESTNVVVDDQGNISTIPRSDERDTQDLLHTLKDGASANDATLGNSSNHDLEDASPFCESLSQLTDPTTSPAGSNREASRQVQKDHSATNIIRDPEAGVRMRGKPKVNYKAMVATHVTSHPLNPKILRKL